MTTEVSDITLDQLILEAINKDKDALDKLIIHPEMSDILDEVSGVTEAKYKQDKDEVRQILVVKMYESIDTVENPGDRALHACLKSWLYSVSGHQSLNDIRHGKVEKKHEEVSTSAESSRGKRKSVEGGEHPLQSCETPAQEQELLDKEERALVRAALQRLLPLLSPREREITKLWLRGLSLKEHGLSLKEIAAITNVSISTVSRAETKVLKALMREVQNGLGEKRDAA